MAGSGLEHADWEARWQEGRIAFHRPSVSEFLTKHADHALGDRIGRVYVPLCGKSLDMTLLAARSDEVVGSEYVELGVSEFFAEQGLEPEITAEPLTTYAAANYRIFAADFFSADREALGPIDAVYDRAALIALDFETRARYVEHMRELLDPGARMLLLTLDYDQREMSGPPFAVSREEVERLYDDGFEVEHLESRPTLVEHFRAQGVTEMHESAYAITRT